MVNNTQTRGDRALKRIDTKQGAGRLGVEKMRKHMVRVRLDDGGEQRL